MRTTFALIVAAMLADAGPLAAQKLVGRVPIETVPAPVLLETNGMFLARYAKVGDDMFIAGQPTEKALRELKSQGVTTVVNLRMPGEMTSVGFDEAKLVADLGMKYVYIPMRGAAGDMSYSPATLAKFSEAIQSADGKVLLHCAVAWRASHIWAAYLIRRGVPDETAVTHARAINLMDAHRVDESGKQPVEMFLGRRVSGLAGGAPRHDPL